MDDPTAVERDLAEVAWLTQLMGFYRTHGENLSDVRRRAILRLRDEDVTYAAIAEAMGTSTQAVYKAIRADLYEERLSNLRQAGESAA